MKKHELIKKHYNQKEALSLDNTNYKRQLNTLLDFFLSEDVRDDGDVTSSLITEKKEITATITARQNGVLAGMQEIQYLATRHSLPVTSIKHDGDPLTAGDEIAKITGNIQDVLTVERTLLNVLQRMSGIATKTHALVSKLVPRPSSPVPLLCATRKTQWGLLDKRAVTLGGGGTHRLGLYDFVLIKDNHLPYIDNLKKVAEELNEKNAFWEIEADTPEQAQAFAKLNPSAIMFDNFSPADIAPLAQELRTKNPDIILEASGGITAQTIHEYSNTGVDIISMGSLTHSVMSLDIGLDIAI